MGDAVSKAAGGARGFPSALTSFVGRAAAVGDVAKLVREFRLVTVTGPGGVGKTRLAAEAVRLVGGEFADGVWLVDLAGVRDPNLVPAAVAAALGIAQVESSSVLQSLAEVLARQQVLVVLDNCEQVAAAVAEVCEFLLLAADDVRILATSREPVGVAGETRYRLQSLTLPKPGEDGDDAEAVALFADRARRVDAHFALTGATRQAVARLVERLDGMPLAIELAAARVESLGVEQLLERIGDRFALLGATERAVAARHRSLAAAVDWSYGLLSDQERRVFRWLSVFPAPFTLDGAEQVAGPAAEPVVLRLVDCSLLSPPRMGPDGRTRYAMLETLRAYAAERLAEAGERDEAAAALAGYMLRVAEQAAADMGTSVAELEAARRLDAEDATSRQVLAWALEHEPAAALRLAIALASWWQLRGRTVAGYALLRAAADHAGENRDARCAGQLWLGHLAYSTHDNVIALGHYTAAIDVIGAEAPARALVGALIGRSCALRNLDRVPEAVADVRRALDLARELGDLAGESLALAELALAAHYAGDHETLLARAREACWIDPALVPGTVVRRREYVLMIALDQAGHVAAAHQSAMVGLAHAGEADDMQSQAAFLHAIVHQEVVADRLTAAGSHLREAIDIARHTGDRLRLIACLDECGLLCVAARRWAGAVTMWSAVSAFLAGAGTSGSPAAQGVTSVRAPPMSRRAEQSREALAALGPVRMREAEERGADMSIEAAAELAIMLTASDADSDGSPPGIPQLSVREQELVVLVAKGRTDAQIAEQLFISVRTVSSHLDRIRDKTGCRRRADITRLALRAGLV